MLELDNVTYAMTRDNAAGPIIQMVDNGLPPMDVPTDGNATRGGLIGYAIAYSLAFGVVAYFILAV
ncbi:hypothetical protein [Sphingobium sp. CECT 9361]|uniref:hypothetical protein n=1 Tax=Sphingobium sp. CECT 9361 TaxID=2845384 RepID=UPI001E4D8B7E|nr:hypothetical protein [Sphingobium sp. CECT 9361]CAH0356384.1 hypothetical protein SPH9361_04049 [Sphingobium sp. CECT 9361]